MSVAPKACRPKTGERGCSSGPLGKRVLLDKAERPLLSLHVKITIQRCSPGPQSKATWVPVSFLVERGQQIKVFSQLTKKARELGYMVPTIKYGSLPEEQYEGATVLE